MVVRPEAPPLTVEHYKNLPETGPRYQLIEGDLHMAPSQNRYHQDISRNLENKKRVYDRHGVKELWIIDPEPREVLVYRFESGSGETAERFYQSDTVTSPLLPGLVVALEEVFRQ